MPTPKVKHKKRIAKLKALAERLGIITAGVVVVLAGITYIARLDALTINSVSVEGSRIVEEKSLVEHTAKVISGSYLFLPKRNILIYPKDNIQNSLRRVFPRLKEVDVKRRDLNTLDIVIEEREPEALWCADGPDLHRGCFYVDENGFVYAKAPFISGDVFFRYFGGDVDPDDPIGDHIDSPEWIKKLTRLNERIEDLGLKPISVNIKEDEFDILLEGGSTLLLSRHVSMEESLSMLATLLQGSEKELLTEEGPQFLYIDLRFGKKRVFYKMR
ncbi:MAG: cell division protein FtsQ/DivIB [Patescibacteria group bacterium]